MKENYKTNAMRILEKEKIPFTAYRYEASDGHIDGISVAEKMGQPIDKVYKTLVTVSDKKEYFVFVIPVAKELDLKAGARSVNAKSVSMIKVADINNVTGYIRGGCSPVGMKKQFVTVIDSSAENLDSFFVSGGKIGYQIKVKPHDIASLINAKFEHIIF